MGGARAEHADIDKRFAYLSRKGQGPATTERADSLIEIAVASLDEDVQISRVEEGFFWTGPYGDEPLSWRVRGRVAEHRWRRLLPLAEAKRELESVLDRLQGRGFGVSGRSDGTIGLIHQEGHLPIAARARVVKTVSATGD